MWVWPWLVCLCVLWWTGGVGVFLSFALCALDIGIRRLQPPTHFVLIMEGWIDGWMDAIGHCNRPLQSAVNHEAKEEHLKCIRCIAWTARYISSLLALLLSFCSWHSCIIHNKAQGPYGCFGIALSLLAERESCLFCMILQLHRELWGVFYIQWLRSQNSPFVQWQ